MDNNLPIIIGAALLILVVALRILRPLINRKAHETGQNLGRKFADSRLPATLEAFGTTLVLSTDEHTARAIAAEAIAATPRRYTALPTGEIGINFSAPDDTIVQVLPTATGVEFRVVKFREYMRFPQTVKQWTALREDLQQRAATAGVSAVQGTGLTYARTQEVEDQNWIWTITT